MIVSLVQVNEGKMYRQRSAVDSIVTSNVVFDVFIMMMIMFGIIENEFLCLGKKCKYA